jgi:hypothetical protein
MAGRMNLVIPSDHSRPFSFFGERGTVFPIVEIGFPQKKYPIGKMSSV